MFKKIIIAVAVCMFVGGMVGVVGAAEKKSVVLVKTSLGISRSNSCRESLRSPSRTFFLM